METGPSNDKKPHTMSEMNAMDIIEAISKKTIRPDLLRKKERLKIVAVMYLEGISQSRIAQILGRTDRTIQRDMYDISINEAKLVSNLSIDRVAGRLVAVAERLMSKAIGDKDYGMAWKIETDLIDKLQSMGYIKQTPSEVQVTGKVLHEHQMPEDYSKKEPAELVSIVRSKLSA